MSFGSIVRLGKVLGSGSLGFQVRLESAYKERSF